MISDKTRTRDRNRYAILRDMQRHGALRRTDLSRRCGIRISSVVSLVDELIGKRFVRLVEQDHPRSAVTFTQGEWYVLAATVASREITFGRVDISGHVDSSFCVALPEESTQDDIVTTLCEGLSSLHGQQPERTLGAGIALTGIVTRSGGIWHSAIHFPSVHNMALMDAVALRLNLPVMIENDARASLWAAVWFDPRLTDCRNAIYLSLCAGVGSALMIDGRPYPGAHQWAGELGHMRAGSEGRHCSCGKANCIETYCSLPALRADILRAAPGLAPLPDAASVAEAIRRNPVAANIAERAMERLGTLLGTLAAYVDPDVILLGNQNPQLYEALLPPLRLHLQRQFQGRGVLDLPIEIVPDAIHAPLCGMGGLILNEVFQGSLSSFNTRGGPFTNSVTS